MGIDIDINGENVTVHGNGLRGLKSLMKCFIQATAVLRHVFYAVFWQVKIFDTSITGDASIQKRPMGRVVQPLSMMGAKSKMNIVRFILRVQNCTV